MLILDGQQRLTSLLYALTAPRLPLKDSARARAASDGFGVFRKKWLPGFGLVHVLAALRTEIENRELGERERTELRKWYWCNVFLERFSSGVESKSRKDYAEFLDHWLEGKPEPAVFGEARARIGAAGYTIRASASYASAVYSGVFCLLAIRGARDWSLGETIQLQKLDNHHIFPRGFLRQHGITKKPVANSIVNRTLICSKTNNRIKAKSPAEYLAAPNVIAPLQCDSILAQHFIDNDARDAMRAASLNLTDADIAASRARWPRRPSRSKCRRLLRGRRSAE